MMKWLMRLVLTLISVFSPFPTLALKYILNKKMPATADAGN
uniref:Uncharacterized protein n=1 Tax=Arundo donax TaxID=35708 RepID=A0A0A9HG55_ARUDO